MPPRKRACLHFINLNPDYTAIDVRINSFETTGNLINGLGYLDTWPHNGYASLLTLQDKDTAWISYRILDHTTGAVILPDTLMRLYEEKAATMILTKDAGGLPILIKTLDSFEPDTDSTGNVRLMNFDETLISVSMYAYTDTLATDTIENIGTLNYTGYRPFDIGNKDIYFINNSIPDTITVLQNKMIRLHRNYSAYIVQNPLTGEHMVFWEEMDKCTE